MLLQLQCGVPLEEPAYLAQTADALGVVAAIARLSRRVLTVEFRAIYVVPPLRGTSIPPALVHFALADVAEQTSMQLTRGGPCVPWGTDAVQNLKAFVVLPHCMQVSAKFWGNIGFQLGRDVDRKEHKQATLSTRSSLATPTPRWTFKHRHAVSESKMVSDA